MTSAWLLTLWLSPEAVCESAAAEAVADEAFRFAEAGELDEAADAYAGAYAIDPCPDYLAARASVEIQSGNCESGVEHIRGYLETDPPEKDLPFIQQLLDRCDATAEPPAAPAPSATASPPPPTIDVPEQHTEPATPKRWWTDGWGTGLTIGGVAVVGVGAGLYATSLSLHRETRTAPTAQAFEDNTGRAQRLHPVGIAALATGGALVVGGVIRYIIVARRGRSSQAAATVGRYSRLP